MPSGPSLSTSALVPRATGAHVRGVSALPYLPVLHLRGLDGDTRVPGAAGGTRV